MTLTTAPKIAVSPTATGPSGTQNTNLLINVAKLAVALLLVLVSLSTAYYSQDTALNLLLPVAAIAMSARIGNVRLVIPALVVLAAGLALLTYQGHVTPVEAVLMLAVSLMVGLIAAPKPQPLMGIYGLLQKTEHEILRSLLSATPVLLLDEQGRIKRASAACADLFKRSSPSLVQTPLVDLLPGFEASLHATGEAGLVEPPQKNWNILRPEAADVSVEIWLGHTPEGPLLRLVDLTPRQTADAQARELHSQLNKVWRLNSLGEMAATLAHELNQPLGAAAAYLHAAQEDMKTAGPLGESAFRTTDMAKNQMLRAGQIIRRMRELLTMEMRALAKESFSSVVDDVLPILTLTGQDRNIRIDTDIVMPDIVRMDRIQVQQALVNLVRNAVEASPNGSSVLITGQPIDELTYEVAVEDSGPGIAPDQVDSVFQPMTTTKSGGMGLGLSVTRTIVESHGGHLRVGKSRWEGARFSFTLSIANQESQQ